MGELPWIDSAIQAINGHIHRDEYFSGKTVVTWRGGSLRLPWGEMCIIGPNARRLGKHELKQMIETPFMELLPNESFTGKMCYQSNNGERSGKILFSKDLK